MAGTSASPRATTRRSRKSIAHFPGGDKENATISGIDNTVKPTRKTRSKSIGPGGLEVLIETAGNSQKILPRSILKPTIPLSPIKQIPPRNKNAELEAKRRAEEEAREKEKREVQERRDARRKSMANRRVSFAPEATLHTWDIVELAEDATTSSEGTNLTRRASSGSTLQAGTVTGNPSFSDPPSTPPRHEIQVEASPADQRRLHQKQNRIDSDANTADLESFSSPGDSIIGDAGMDLDSEESDDDKDSVEAADDNDSIHSESPDQTGSSSSSARLDRSLRNAILQAENQDLTVPDDITMDLIDDETGLVPLTDRNHVTTTSQEAVNPFSPAFAKVTTPDESAMSVDQSEMSMDMTMMMGGILNGSPKKGKRKSIAPSTRRSMARRRSSADSAILADETMDFVTTYGGIQGLQDQTGNQEISMDMTRAVGGLLPNTMDDQPSMDLTRAVGGILALNQPAFGQDEEQNEASMDLTRAIGSVLPQAQPMRVTRAAKRASLALYSEDDNGRYLSPVTEYTEPSESNTGNMDFTQAVGQILPNDDETMDVTKAVGSILSSDLKTSNRLVAKQLMEEEADHGQLVRSPFAKKVEARKSPRTTTPSPSKLPGYLSTTQSAAAKGTPSKTPGTPSGRLTPQPTKPPTPSKTPPNPNISMRKTSPKRLFKTNTSKSPLQATPLQLSKDLVLTPRRLSGVGIDQAGLGSPLVAAKLDRRASIGDSTPQFVPGRKLRFEDPKTIELEEDHERAAEQQREAGRNALEHEDEPTLRDMIKSLTPKKNKYKGRKSLAPSAKGILGKRPAELDDEDEDATPKKLKGNRSPVKSIHLPAPQKDTTLRLSQVPQFVLPGVTPISNEPKTATTPSHGRSVDIGTGVNIPTSFNEREEGSEVDLVEEPDTRISLQDFLNLTNIRFMDLTTTKRRHTVNDEQKTQTLGESTLADCVVAGVCTIPMLDLFQHSCRELKKYITEGRSVVREIEQDTLVENPTLFREYMAASLEVRAIMDNQFKNIKTHARGESKATWYEWRSKLFDGLRSGLVTIHEGLLRDDKLLGDQEELLHDNVALLQGNYVALTAEAKSLQAQVDELASSDQDELRSARQELQAREEDIAEKRRLLQELQTELQQGKQAVIEAEERKVESLAEIREAERVASENRGWSYEEVKALKDKIDLVEQKTGWTIRTADGTRITFTLQKTLSLSIGVSQGCLTQQPVSLTLSSEPSMTQRFFLENLTTRLSTLADSKATHPEVKTILDHVKTQWELAQDVTAELESIKSKFHTTERLDDDKTLLIESMILLRAPEEMAEQSKIHAGFTIKFSGEGLASEHDIRAKAKVVYGKAFEEKQITRFLEQKIKHRGKVVFGSWQGALVELKTALLQGKIASA